MSSKRDWTEGLPELFEGYTEAAPEGLWEAVEAGSGASARRRRIAGWWYAGGALLAAAAVVLAVILFRPAAGPSVIQVSSGEMVAESPAPSPSATSTPIQVPSADTETTESVSGEAKPAGQTPETLQSVSGEAKPAGQTPETPQSVSGEANSAGQTPESGPQKPFKLKQRQIIRVQAGVFGGGLIAQNVVQSGQTATHIASVVGSAPAIQTKSISGGSTTFNPAIINRNKPSTTECNHRQTAHFGAGIKVNFLPHWGVETGVAFTTLNSSWVTTSGNSVQSVEREMRYVGIPLYLHFNALEWRGVSLYLAAGPMYEFADKSTLNLSTSLGGKLLSSATDNSLTKDSRWSANIGAGLQLEFMDNNAIYIQPGLSYHFPHRNVDGLDLQNYYTARPASFNLTIGYRLLLF